MLRDENFRRVETSNSLDDFCFVFRKVYFCLSDKWAYTRRAEILNHDWVLSTLHDIFDRAIKLPLILARKVETHVMMGLCLCKDDEREQRGLQCCNTVNSNCRCCFRWGKRSGSGGSMFGPPTGRGAGSAGGTLTPGVPGLGRDDSGSPNNRSISNLSDATFLLSFSPEVVNHYVLETLKVLRTLVGK